MTTTPTTPTTSTEANTMLAALRTKQAGLVQSLAAGADRRAELATESEFGSNTARAALQKIDDEETAARAAIRNLDVVISVMERTRDKLQAQEAAAREGRNVAELHATIDALLVLDDEIDDALDHARALLAKRDEFKREHSQILRRAAAGKLPGSRAGEIAESILAYFDTVLNGHNEGRSYAALTRVADWDAKYFGRPSPRQIERGPRELSPMERVLRQALAPRRASVELRQAAQH